jgi:methanethiol S-methyltransferase
MFEATWPMILILGWLGYFLLHSALASLPLKRLVASRWPRWMPAYRLLFNMIAVLLLLPLLWLTYAVEAEPLWSWSGVAGWLADGLALLAIMAFLWTTRFYDSGEFLGTSQWRGRERRVEEQEHLRISPLHRHVRHPWYLLALLLLWSRDMNAPLLITVIMATLYFLIGSRLEERKLLQYYGDAYARYRERVPAIFPLPWRRLSVAEASRLEAMARDYQQRSGAVRQ